jgi:hypothetical protein
MKLNIVATAFVIVVKAATHALQIALVTLQFVETAFVKRVRTVKRVMPTVTVN